MDARTALAHLRAAALAMTLAQHLAASVRGLACPPPAQA
jgi:hypothetical protein